LPEQRGMTATYAMAIFAYLLSAGWALTLFSWFDRLDPQEPAPHPKTGDKPVAA